MILVFDRPEEVQRWVEHHLDMPAGSLTPCTAIGIASEGKVIGGVVYNEYRQEKFGSDIRLHIATTTPKWATRQNIRLLLLFPFERLGCNRVTAVVAKRNKRCRRFIEGIGFKLEGCCRKAFDGIEDAVIYGMLKEECRWIGESNGQVVA